MTVQVSYVKDLEVKSDRTEIDRAFFNRRFKPIFDELVRLDTDFASYGAAESTLVQIGLDRINTTLGPALDTLQSAAELGFLWGKSIGTAVSLVVGEFKGFVITENAELFTPTPVLLVQDLTDTTNWGLVTLDEDGWHNTTGELATHCIYASKTKSSTQWFISSSAAIFPAMQDLLAQCTAAKNATAASAATVAAQMATLQSAINAIQTGPVSSVAGKTGAVTLVEADIGNGSGGTVATDLAAKASVTYVNTQTSGKQTASAKLDALANLAWSSNRILYATGAGTLSLLTVTDFIKTLLDDANTGDAQTTLGISAFAKTLLDDASAADARTTLGIAAAPEIPVKASAAEVTTGTDDAKFVTALGAASRYLPRTVTVNSQAVTGYTLVNSDHGNILRFTSSSAIACYLPAGAQVGFNTMIEQAGTGQVTINIAVNATRRSFGNRFKLAGQNAVASVYCTANSDGNHAEWNVNGNLVA